MKPVQHMLRDRLNTGLGGGCWYARKHEQSTLPHRPDRRRVGAGRAPLAVPEPGKGGRPRIHSLREIVNAIFYLVRSGCAWRLLPREFPPWQTV
jgi:Putative transposase of IS4/5 family (DUF4096)